MSTVQFFFAGYAVVGLTLKDVHFFQPAIISINSERERERDKNNDNKTNFFPSNYLLIYKE